MKKLYSRNDNRGLLTGGRAVAAVVAVVVILLLVLRMVFPGVLISLASPLWSAGDVLTAAVGSAAGSFESEDQVREERDRLRLELQERTNAYHALEAELRDRGALGEATERISAGVIARPPQSPYDTLIVGAGNANGVEVGAQAYGSGGVPVGTIAQVQSQSAHLSLYSTPGRTTLGWAGEARTPVTIEGAGSGAFRASISKDATVAVGELVYVPGPGALPIGSIARIDTNPSSPTATLFIRPLANPFSLTWVAIAPLP